MFEAIVPDLINNLSSHPWAIWFIVAVICAILEILLPSFFFIFVSIGALCAALSAHWGDAPLQIGIFSFVLLLTLFLLRPRLLEKLHTKNSILSRTQALVGKTGRVTDTIDPVTKTGRVLIEGQDWAAQGLKLIESGATIVVEGSDGIVLTVKEL